MKISDIHKLFIECKSISIDTRKIEPNSFFVAIKGERFDANTFTKEALDKGASYVIIDNPKYFIDNRTILVNDSMVTLQELAKYHRQYLKIPIIALTGSNGKTTTKELIQVVLAKKYNAKATIGNLNNHIGVPLTLLSFDNNTEIGIVEMGANHQKEIEFLCEIALPDFGYITNFGKAHLEGFGGVEGVIKGKSELYNYLSKKGKIAFVNIDDAIQVEKTKSLNKFTFGVNQSNVDLNIAAISANPFVELIFLDNLITSQIIGEYNATNISAAIAIGTYFKVSKTDIKSAIETFVPDNNRSQLLQKNTNGIILDAYNANPSSMKAAIENFIQLDKSNKIAILGDMFELGIESYDEHKKIRDLLLNQNDIKTYFIGKDFYQHKIEQSNIFFYESYEAFLQFLNKNSWINNTILIKGSRGMALERVLDII